MNIVQIVVSLVFLVVTVLANQECMPPSNGSTHNLREIVIGRCNEFFNVANAKECSLSRSQFNCENIWKTFSQAIIGKEPCSIKQTDFDSFLSEVDHPVPVNKTLFWSGTYALASDIAHLFNYWPLEYSLSGYLMDNLKFCSNKNEPDFVTSYCPLYCVYRSNPFWNAVSTKFAQKAIGDVTVVLNGTRPQGALANYSTFFNYELPNLSADSVTSLKVILLHMPGMLKHETCKSPRSLKVLQHILAEKSIAYECEDNPTEIMQLMCMKVPHADECAYFRDWINSKSARNVFSLNRFMIFSLFSIVLVLI